MTEQTAQPEQDPGPVIQPFAAFLQQQAHGRSHDELSKELHNLLHEVSVTGKPGKLTYTINVKPGGDYMQVIVTDDVKLTPPKSKRPESFWFVDDAGNLSRKDPRQQELPLREVTRQDAASAKSVGR